jgi:hypothetical protein
MRDGISRLFSTLPLVVAAFALICSLTGAPFSGASLKQPAYVFWGADASSTFVDNPTAAMPQQELSDRVAALLT